MPFTDVKVLRSYSGDKGGFAYLSEAVGTELTTIMPVTGTSPFMSDSYFIDVSSNHNGGVFNLWIDDITMPFTNVRIENVEAGRSGGFIHHHDETMSKGSFTFTGSQFYNSHALNGQGGAIKSRARDFDFSFVMTNNANDISEFSSTGSGGFIYADSN
jgi:hypothetical protein